MKSSLLPLLALPGLLSVLVQTSSATLVAYWPMDDIAGSTTARDVVAARNATWGNINTSTNTPTNLGWIAAGKFGGAADLGGQTSAANYFTMNLANRIFDDVDPSLGAQGFTISAWIQPDGTASDYKGIVMSRNAVNTVGNGANGNWGLAYINTSTPTDFRNSIDSRVNSSSLKSKIADVIDVPAVGAWNHVALVWNGVDGYHTLFLNGKKYQISTDPNVTLIGRLTGTGTWRIGSDNNSNARNFDGKIDDVAMWNEALTDAEIAELFATTKRPLDIRAPLDTDGDGMLNSYELLYPGFLDPNVPDAGADVDRIGGVIGGALTPDGLTNIREQTLGTNPANPDTDGDGLLDGAEVDIHRTNPLVADTDMDGILDGEEVIPGVDGFITNPLLADTDGDAISDSQEITNGTNPTDPYSPPPIALPTTGLVALYNFDEGTGTTAADSAATDGLQSATTNVGSVGWQPVGKIGGSLDLNGGAHLLANDAIPQNATDFTMTAWIKPRTQGAYKGIFATRVAAPFTGEPNLNWGLNVTGSPLLGDLRMAAGASSTALTTPAIPLNEWHHLALVYSFGTATAYLDGRFTQTLATGRSFYTSSGFYAIGTDPGGTAAARQFDGEIDDLSVWTTALTPREVTGIYLRGLLGTGIPGTVNIEFKITDIRRNTDGTVLLSFTSEASPQNGPANLYSVIYTTDVSKPLNQWIEDSDNVLSQGSTTTYRTVSTFAGAPRIFFAVKKNPPQ